MYSIVLDLPAVPTQLSFEVRQLVWVTTPSSPVHRRRPLQHGLVWVTTPTVASWSSPSCSRQRSHWDYNTWDFSWLHRHGDVLAPTVRPACLYPSFSTPTTQGPCGRRLPVLVPHRPVLAAQACLRPSSAFCPEGALPPPHPPVGFGIVRSASGSFVHVLPGSVLWSVLTLVDGTAFGPRSCHVLIGLGRCLEALPCCHIVWARRVPGTLGGSFGRVLFPFLGSHTRLRSWCTPAFCPGSAWALVSRVVMCMPCGCTVAVVGHLRPRPVRLLTRRPVAIA